MIPLDIISVRYENPLLTGARTSASAGFTRLAEGIADQYGSVFSGTALAGLYTNTGTLSSGTSVAPVQSQQPRSSGFPRQSALAAYSSSQQSPPIATPSTVSLAASIRQTALTAPLILYGSEQQSLAQSLDLFA